jgi:hypothetical protein
MGAVPFTQVDAAAGDRDAVWFAKECKTVIDSNARPTGLMWCCSAVSPSVVRWHRNARTAVISLASACMTSNV